MIENTLEIYKRIIEVSRFLSIKELEKYINLFNYLNRKIIYVNKLNHLITEGLYLSQTIFL